MDDIDGSVTSAGCTVVHASRRPFLPCSVRKPRLTQFFPTRGNLGVETACSLHDLSSGWLVGRGVGLDWIRNTHNTVVIED